MVTKTLTPELWYQNAVINGVEMPARRRTDTSGKRWETFIEPLVNRSEGTFVELGCNAGFYLRKVVDMGYKAIGVENHPMFIQHARYWEDQEPKGVTIIESDLNKFDLPVTHYVLLANLHYWLTLAQLETLVKKLKARALKVIVVGRQKSLSAHRSPCDLDSLKKLLWDWHIPNVIIGDKHYSVLFTSLNLREMNVDDIQFNIDNKDKTLIPLFTDLIKKVLSGEEFEQYGTAYFDYLKLRTKNPGHVLARHINLIEDIKKNGITAPLKVNKKVLLDGDHRLIIARHLGIRKVICQIL